MTVFRNFIFSFALALVIFGLLGFGLFSFVSSSITAPPPTIDSAPPDQGSASGEEETKPTDTTPPSSQITGINGDSFAVLYVLSDYQPDVFDDYKTKGEVDENGFPKDPREIRTPAIVLEIVSKETGECVFTSIPASTLTTIDGMSRRLYELYDIKGIDALCSKVSSLTGIPVDYYAVYEPKNFEKMIDKLNGVSCYVNAVVDYTQPNTTTSIHINRGIHTLNGKKASAMLMCANYADTYVTQSKNAVSFVRDFFDQIMKTMSENHNEAALTLTELVKYADKTNITNEKLMAHMDLILSYTKMSQIEYSYPGSKSEITGADSYFSANTTAATGYFSKYKFRG